MVVSRVVAIAMIVQIVLLTGCRPSSRSNNSELGSPLPSEELQWDTDYILEMSAIGPFHSILDKGIYLPTFHIATANGPQSERIALASRSGKVERATEQIERYSRLMYRHIRRAGISTWSLYRSINWARKVGRYYGDLSTGHDPLVNAAWE